MTPNKKIIIYLVLTTIFATLSVLLVPSLFRDGDKYSKLLVYSLLITVCLGLRLRILTKKYIKKNGK